MQNQTQNFSLKLQGGRVQEEKCTEKTTDLSYYARKNKSTWVNAFLKWAQFCGFQENIAEYEPFDLNTVRKVLRRAEIRKKDGTNYELRVFELEGKFKALREQGILLHRHLSIQCGF